MTIQLVGFSEVNYLSKAGKKVTGLRVFGIDLTTTSPELSGHTVFEEFISGFNSSGLELGELYEVNFEQYKFKGRYESKVTGLIHCSGKED